METFASSDNNTAVNPLAGRMFGEYDRDWRAYLEANREIRENNALETREVIALKQACALAYLGKRSQNEGGVYSKTRVRILTPEFVQTMAKTNTAQRHKRYPWLERLLSLLDEIDEVQDQIALKGKVLSIMTHKQTAQLPQPRVS